MSDTNASGPRSQKFSPGQRVRGRIVDTGVLVATDETYSGMGANYVITRSEDGKSEVWHERDLERLA